MKITQHAPDLFFQLEVLESTRLTILSNKVGLIQRAWRWHRFRRMKKTKNEAARKIQCAWSEFRARQMRREAIVIIQKSIILFCFGYIVYNDNGGISSDSALLTSTLS